MNHLGDPLVRKRILLRIAALKPETPPQWGRMNAHQMLCHMSDAFRVSMGRRSASPDSNLLKRTAIKWLALYAPLPWPKGYPAPPEIMQGAGGTKPDDFHRDRAELLYLIDEFCDPCRPHRFAAHPVFGKMECRQWLRWGYLHTDHHLRQFGV